MQGFGFGSGAWATVTTVIAVCIGSYFAGRCAPVLGWLHGLLACAVMILVLVYAMASLAGSALSAIGTIASTSANAAASAQASPSTSNALDSARQQVQSATAVAGSEASSPQAEQDARQATDTAPKNVARASWYSFAALLVGVIISIVSGAAGFGHQPPFEDRDGPNDDERSWNASTFETPRRSL